MSFNSSYYKQLTNFPYEIHITVASCDLDLFKEHCQAIGFKPLLIDLQKSGQSIGHQLMCTKRCMESDYLKVVSSMTNASIYLAAHGLKIQRHKIETTVENSQMFNSKAYYECHVPVEIKDEKDFTDIQIFLYTGWHVSRNAFKKLEIGSVYFLTYRTDEKSDNQLDAKINDLIAHLNNLQIKVHLNKIERECVLLDTNQDLDKEWLKHATIEGAA